ncbi:MAG: hypothetical protein HQL77_02150 [Magnetococcales bacterium]|nr:hypothetical protein [Magnetococcales bacterium]
MSTYLRVAVTALLVGMSIGTGQAGELPWGSEYYRLRPGTDGGTGTFRRDHGVGAEPTLPESKSGGAEKRRPWGEVPAEFAEGNADRQQTGRGDEERVDGGRWGTMGMYQRPSMPYTFGWPDFNYDALGVGSWSRSSGWGWRRLGERYADPGWWGNRMGPPYYYPDPFDW